MSEVCERYLREQPTLKWTKKWIRSIVCYCTHKEKINLKGFTQNGCYGNKPQVVFYSIHANTSCSFFSLLQNKIWLSTEHNM